MNLTVREAAKMLNVPEEHVYRWIREKDIPAHRVGDNYRFNRSELLEWATVRGIRISPSEFHRAEEEAASLVTALEAGGVHHGVEATNRESALRAVVSKIPIDEDEREQLVDVLLAREALGSTGVGDGIAIPHVRNPIVMPVSQASVTLCFLEKPVDFDAIDKKPVTTIFLLVTPTVRAHLSLLSRLSAALHDPAFKEAIIKRKSRDEILAEAVRLESVTSQRPPMVEDDSRP